MARPLIIIAVLALAAAEARPGCSEKDEAAMAESYQKCLTDVNERSHKEMAKIKSNSDYQVGKPSDGAILEKHIHSTSQM